MTTGDRYNVPPSPGADIEQRFRKLEQAVYDGLFNRTLRHSVLPQGSVRILDANGAEILVVDGDGLRMLDADGDVRAKIGALGGGRYGVLILDGDGTTARLQVDERGVLSPYTAAPVVAADDFKTVTSATFEVTHRGQLESIVSEGIYWWQVVAADVGTTGEFRLKNAESSAVTQTVTVGSGAQVTQQFRWLHGSPLSAGPVVFALEARVTSGAGSLYCYRSPGLWQVAPGLCVADGVP